MTATKTSKLVISLIVFAFILETLAVIHSDDYVELPLKLLYFCRMFVMIQSGFFIGLTLACAIAILRLKIDPEDILLRPLGALAGSAAILSVYAIITIINVLDHPHLTWRVPVLFLAFAIGDWSLAVLLRRLNRIANKARNHFATIKLTFTDIGGADMGAK